MPSGEVITWLVPELATATNMPLPYAIELQPPAGTVRAVHTLASAKSPDTVSLALLVALPMLILWFVVSALNSVWLPEFCILNALVELVPFLNV